MVVLAVIVAVVYDGTVLNLSYVYSVSSFCLSGASG